MHPSLRQLQYAVSVADHLSFRRAAETCHVSQPGLSAQLAQLETRLGVRLFERDRKRVMLTPEGEALVPRAREILALAGDLTESARALSRPLAGTLRLGVIPTVAPYLLPRALPAVRRRHPELRVLLCEERTPVLAERLRAGRLDLLLLALEADLGPVETRALFEDPFLLAVPAGHRLAGRRAVREGNLAGETVLLLDDGHCLREQALAVCERAGADEYADYRATSLGTLLQVVAGGEGVTLLPSIAADRAALRGARVELIAFRRPAPRRTIGLAWRRGSARGHEYRLLAETLAPR